MRTPKVILILVGMLGLGVAGCGESGDIGSLNPFRGMGVLKKSNESSALAQLKRYSSEQSSLLVHEGSFAHKLSDLYTHLGYREKRDTRLLGAWHRSEAPVPLKGYLFADIQEDEDGGALTDGFRCGLSAYPAEPGVSGDRVMLILLDERSVPMPSDADGGFVGGDNWRLFWAKPEDIEAPVTRWPTEHELQSTFHELRTRTPQEGLRDAQEAIDDFRSGRSPKAPCIRL